MKVLSLNFLKLFLVMSCLMAFQGPQVSWAAQQEGGGVSRRSFLTMLGGALGAAAIGPRVSVLANAVMAERVNEAQQLMQIRSSLDFDFLRRSAWERYFTGKVTVATEAEMVSLQAYRGKLMEFMAQRGVSPEGQQLAQMLYRSTNNFYPFDISPQEYIERSRRYFENQRATTMDFRSEEVIQRVEDSFDRIYRETQTAYESGEIERNYTLRCSGFLGAN